MTTTISPTITAAPTTDEPTSLSDLARRFGVSRERARQLEGRLLARFRRFAAAPLGVDDAPAALAA